MTPIWDALKAYMHGILIAFKAFRDRNQELIIFFKKALMDTIQQIENKNKQAASQQTGLES